MRNIAIVTGASSGIGRIYAQQLAGGRGGHLDEVWLIARGADKMHELAATLPIASRVIPLDLSDPSSLDAVDAALAEEDTCVQWLINCAGYGKFGDFTQISREDTRGMINLNCLAVVEMCYRCLPYCKAGSHIINLASMAAVVPQPELSVYGATKRFVLDFSRAINYELAPVGIHVTAVCPKFMDTGFLGRAGRPDAAARKTFIGFEQPARVVEVSLAAAIRGVAMCVPSWDMKVMHVLTKVLPTQVILRIEDELGRALAPQNGASAQDQA